MPGFPARVVRTLDDVPGWFYPHDQALMTWFLQWQDRTEPPGDLLELGAYLGKSAILLGQYRRPGERLTVCDLFDSPAPDAHNSAEMSRSYSTLTRRTFESNYLAFHDELPVIIEGPTSVIVDHVPPASCRFVHIDASHLYEHVRADLEASRTLLRPGGLVVCDDYRAAHTPGVAAAVWSAVTSGDLRPICLTANKFYGAWSPPEPIQQELVGWLAAQGPATVDLQIVAGHPVARINRWADPPRPVVRATRTQPSADRAPVTLRRTARAWSRKAALQLLPPVLTNAIRNARRARYQRQPRVRDTG
jgi:predicted O-methyltransferase YrrM